MLALETGAPSTAGAFAGRTRLGGAFSIAIDRIRPDPTQPRRQFDDEELAELSTSVARLGILQPITVRYIEDDDIYQIIAGERRYRAATAAGLSEIPCWIKTPKSSEILVHQIVENWQRAELRPLEIATSLATLLEANGYTQRQLAELTGKSEGDISKFLALLNLDPEVRQQAVEQSLHRRQLYSLTKLAPDEQREATATITRDKLTAADTEELVRRISSRQGKIPRRGAPVARFQFATNKASVALTFRQRIVTQEEILAALDEARAKVIEKVAPLNIVRAK